MTEQEIRDRLHGMREGWMGIAAAWEQCAIEAVQRANHYRRSMYGTWAVNLVLSGVIVWLLWGR